MAHHRRRRQQVRSRSIVRGASVDSTDGKWKSRYLRRTLARTAAAVERDGGRSVVIGRVRFSNQVRWMIRVGVEREFVERGPERRVFGGNRFGPIFCEQHRTDQIAHFILEADFEKVETYPVYTLHGRLLNDFDADRSRKTPCATIYAELMPASTTSISIGPIGEARPMVATDWRQTQPAVADSSAPSEEAVTGTQPQKNERHERHEEEKNLLRVFAVACGVCG